VRVRTFLSAACVMLVAVQIAGAAQAGSSPAKAAAKKKAPAKPAAPALAVLSRDPYQGAILVDAATGQVLFEDRADEKGYPASMLKLMDLLIIVEKVEQGSLKLDDKVQVTREAMQIGGSQVYLDEKETFTVDELLYALVVQSANDAAAALAIHVTGSRAGFCELMNQKARQLGMKSTIFRSVHGLPPGAGQEPDVTTARDFSLLALELLRHPQALKYTSTQEHTFRPEKPFILRNHNKLLGTFDGCDGLKTGYFRAAGFSVCATACRKGVRVAAVVLGCTEKTSASTQAAELLAKGFMTIKPPEPEFTNLLIAPPALTTPGK